MTHQERVSEFRRWRWLVAQNPKRFRVRFIHYGTCILTVLDEYVLTCQGHDGKLSWRTGGGPEWEWDTIAKLPDWKTFYREAA